MSPPYFPEPLSTHRHDRHFDTPLPGAGAASATKPVTSAAELMIESAIIAEKPTVRWADIVGLDIAKQALHEVIVLPSLRADLFQVCVLPW